MSAMHGPNGIQRSLGADRWAVILAGGDGTRLRSLTRCITGDERPKQFTPILGAETLLGQTRRRTILAVPRDHTFMVFTRAHERFYNPLLSSLPPASAVIQPANRGTAPAIFFSLLHVAARAPTALVGIFPSDHFVSDDAAFMAHVDAAFGAVPTRPDDVVILGIVPDGPEGDYGWIEPADPLTGDPGVASRVRGFWEKPSRDYAGVLWARGCLWNSFVMVGRVTAFLSLIREALPEMAAQFQAVWPALGTAAEPEAVLSLYARLREINFSREVLTTHCERLAVLPVLGVRWSDWGDPGRVLRTLDSLGIRPGWLEDSLPVPA